MPGQPSNPTTTTYHAHRERQRAKICAAARKLFKEQGIDRTTMAEVIAASDVRASTMYQYYSSKDDLVWDLVREALEQVAAEITKSMERATSGLAKINALLDYFADELTFHPDRVRFMAQFDAMYAQHWSAERLVTLERRLEQDLSALGELIREGIADGSLRQDLDPDITLHAVINAVVGAQRRLASLGTKVELEYGHSVDRLIRETNRILILGLQAPSTVPGHETKPTRKSSRRKRAS